MLVSPNKFLQSDQIALSCLLQNAQKTRHRALAAEERRYAELRRIWYLKRSYKDGELCYEESPCAICSHQ